METRRERIFAETHTNRGKSLLAIASGRGCAPFYSSSFLFSVRSLFDFPLVQHTTQQRWTTDNSISSLLFWIFYGSDAIQHHQLSSVGAAKPKQNKSNRRRMAKSECKWYVKYISTSTARPHHFLHRNGGKKTLREIIMETESERDRANDFRFPFQRFLCADRNRGEMKKNMYWNGKNHYDFYR